MNLRGNILFPDPVNRVPSAIVDPRDRASEMRVWVDAYTIQLEAQGQAFQDPGLRQTVVDAIRDLQGAFDAIVEGATGKEDARAALENQKQVLDFIDRFDWEAFKTQRATWKRVRAELLQTSFDLRQEITFNNGNDGITRIGQRGTGSPLKVTGAEAQVAVAFLTWVSDNQRTIDPLHYTRTILARSGIKSYADFEANKDKFSITNPWKTTPSIIAP